MNAAAEAKIQMLKASLECFVFGLLGLLPLIGLPFAVAALVVSGKVRVRQKNIWNAARSYWMWGVVCGVIGAVLWSVMDTILIFHMVTGPN
jgi:membrane protease YdiL (CAAX protease family)